MSDTRQTVRFDADVAAAAKNLARTEHISFGKAINRLARHGLTQAGTAKHTYTRPFPARSLGAHLDYTSYERVIEELDGPGHK